MPRKKHKPEEIIIKLREADIALNEGKSVDEVVRKMNVNKNTYYKWRKEYGGLEMDQVQIIEIVEKFEVAFLDCHCFKDP